jgi:hypothetical protein
MSSNTANSKEAPPPPARNGYEVPKWFHIALLLNFLSCPKINFFYLLKNELFAGLAKRPAASTWTS